MAVDGQNTLRLHNGYRFKNRVVITVLRLLDWYLALLHIRKRVLPVVPRSILVMKPDHLGDLLMLTAVLPLLATRYPSTSIDLLCGPWGEAIVANNPRVRRTIPLVHMAYDRRPVSGGRKLLDFLAGLRHIFPILCRERYDLCINLRDAGGDLILLARLAGCRHIVGHATGGFGPLLDTVVNWEEGRHEVEHFLEVLRPLGIKADLSELNSELFPQPHDYEKVTQIMMEKALRLFAVIHPGSGDRRKLLPADEWARLADKIDSSLKIVITGTGDEQPLFDEISRHTGRELVSLMGSLTVPQLFLLMQRSTGVYALDSLAAHLGAVAGIPTKVFWSENNDPGQWRPLGKEVTLIGGINDPPADTGRTEVG